MLEFFGLGNEHQLQTNRQNVPLLVFEAIFASLLLVFSGKTDRVSRTKAVTVFHAFISVWSDVSANPSSFLEPSDKDAIKKDVYVYIKNDGKFGLETSF